MSEPSRVSGALKETKGNVVETIGNMTGSESWTQSGREQQQLGAAEKDAARAQQHAEGWKDESVGKLKQDTAMSESQRKEGKTQQLAGEAAQKTSGL